MTEPTSNGTVAAPLPDLMSIGGHCAAPDCGQLDFLPFVCDACRLTFCLEHRAYASHACTAAAATQQLEVLVCPLCAQGIRVAAGEDPNAAFARHAAPDGGCDPANYARVHQRPKCPAPQCKERIGPTNAYDCRACGRRVCIRHRHPEDHGCAGHSARRNTIPQQQWQDGVAAAAAAAAAAGRGLGVRAGGLVAELRQGAAAAAGAARVALSTGAAPTDPANTLRGSVARRQAQAQGHQMCPYCGASFSSASGLHAHMVTAHGDAHGGADGRGGNADRHEVYECPRCAARFGDALLLFSHAERCNGAEAAGRAPQQSACVLC